MNGVPVRIGNYHVLGLLAEGGMGVVFQAVHMTLNRHCALKVLRCPALRSHDARARFRIEAEAAARLRHPNIVELREAGEVDGESFLEMELVDGLSLAERVAAGGVDLQTFMRWIAGVARGLQHAHEFGVLHRDVKPANILVDDSAGLARLTDFGLARLADEESDLTASLSALGTPAYMAPEVAHGGGRAATVRSDVYGLGAVLYEVLAGHPPYRADSAVAVLACVQREAP